MQKLRKGGKKPVSAGLWQNEILHCTINRQGYA
jgi:hypothetical protein